MRELTGCGIISVLASAESALQDYYDQQESTAQYALPPRTDCAFEIDQIENDSEEQNANHRKSNPSLSSGQPCSPDHNGCNCIQLPSGACDRLSRTKAAGEDNAPEPS